MTEMLEPEVIDTDTDAGDVGQEHAGRCIVALPTATEPVHHLGDVSEPKHLTLVYLGSPEDNPNLDMDQVRGEVEAVAEQSGPLTGLVESTGQLGDEGATVWFVRGDGIEEIRNDLLAKSYIKDGFGVVEQFPTFTPHVTAGYDLEEPLDEETSPEEIIFDKLAVWDGDEHTEYPLGPSAESTVPEGPGDTSTPVITPETGVFMVPDALTYTTVSGEDMGLNQQLLANLTEMMSKPLAINDADSLAAAVEQCNDGCGTAQLATRPILMKRARELRLQHLIPSTWLREAAQRAVKATKSLVVSTPASEATSVSDVPLFQAKHELSGLTDTALRTAYVRGVREFTMTAPQSRPPLPRDVVAQARVNSLIRLAQGDPSARVDDQDLLP